MNADLLTVARTLAERGWLPGMAYMEGSVSNARPARMLKRHGEGNFLHDWSPATEADLHLAAHNEIVRRGWQYDVMPETDEIVIKDRAADDGTTTLSLLRALLLACEAAKRNEGAKR